MKERNKIICIDIDGTLIDFKRIDNAIINKIFSKSKFVMLLDEFLWKINDLDIVGYNRLIFYLRIVIYSLLSFSNITFVFNKYERMYYLLAKEQINEEKIEAIKKLESLGYGICFVTRNMYAKHLIKHIGFKTIIVKDKRKFYFKSNDDIAYIIGNNYSDDIFSSYLFNFKNKIKGKGNYAKGIYIGKSKIVDKIISKNILSFYDIESCIYCIKRRMSKV